MIITRKILEARILAPVLCFNVHDLRNCSWWSKEKEYVNLAALGSLWFIFQATQNWSRNIWILLAPLYWFLWAFMLVCACITYYWMIIRVITHTQHSVVANCWNTVRAITLKHTSVTSNNGILILKQNVHENGYIQFSLATVKMLSACCKVSLFLGEITVFRVTVSANKIGILNKLHIVTGLTLSQTSDSCVFGLGYQFY